MRNIRIKADQIFRKSNNYMMFIKNKKIFGFGEKKRRCKKFSIRFSSLAEFVALVFAGVGVDGDKGRSSGEAAEDFAGIDKKGLADLGDFELVVVTKTDNIVTAGFGKDPANVVVVSQTKAAAVDDNCRHFAVEVNVRKGAAVLGNAKEIAVVVAKDDVDVAEVVLAEFVDDEGGAEVAATEERVGMLELF